MSLLRRLLPAPNLKPCHYSTATISQLVYTEYGDPIKVINLAAAPLCPPSPNEVVVKMLAAPVNPADINTIQGKYPVRPRLPAVPGNEGVGEVLEVGAQVAHFAPGDRAVPFGAGLGTWRTHLTVPEAQLFKVPADLGLVEAATLTVNPCTAFRMLRDFERLKPGDTVLQNGANSACGQSVIQIARAWGLRSVNVVRERPGLAELRAFLRRLGATHVLTEQEVRATELFKEGGRPRLALNCVGGRNALEMLRHLERGGTMVTYGGMSREPVTVPTSALIFKDVRVRGFWMTEWVRRNADSVDRYEMLDELVCMMQAQELQGPACELVPFGEFKEALLNTATVKGMVGKKFLLTFV